MTPLRQYISAGFERARLQLAGSHGLLLLALLGLLCGILSASIIILFRLLIESIQAGFLPYADPENYEELVWQWRLMLPIAGGLLLGVIFYFSGRPPIRVGIVHVLERMGYQEGQLPLKHALYQFFGGVIAIISGHSVGREAPSVHLGAATGSLLGQKLRLPNNSIRSLVACGAAGAIAASFNTPLAGVVFAMEVIMMEYTITGFIPIILSGVSATAVSHLVFESHPAFSVPALKLHTLWELVVILLMGIAIGAIAAFFIKSLRWVTHRSRSVPVWLSMPVAGLGVGLLAILCPQVMGIGYDTVNEALVGSLSVQFILLILVCKLAATILCIGFSIPAGLIGPVLFIGALFGSMTGQLLGVLPGEISHPGLYTMLGMGAMMGATLQAPLAALIALLELTGNQNIIFPGMLAVVSASLAAQELFGSSSVYLSQMREMGLDYRNDPVAQSLRRLGVAAVMNRKFALVQPVMERKQLENILQDKPRWLVITRKEINQLMPAADVARFLETSEENTVNLMEVPSRRRDLAPVLQEATLQQALNIMNRSEAEALYVIKPMTAADRIYGIITRRDIEEKYRYLDSDPASPVR